MSRSFKSDRPAAFKLRVYFIDGGTVSLKSRDYRGKVYLPAGGLTRLIGYVTRHRHRIKTALIYDKRGGKDDLIGKYLNQTWSVDPNDYLNTINQ
ncbi:MAG: hypothetical protein AAF570_02550 [Bacteroidota bacterium]